MFISKRVEILLSNLQIVEFIQHFPGDVRSLVELADESNLEQWNALVALIEINYFIKDILNQKEKKL